jgi:hypothetical protein
MTGAFRRAASLIDLRRVWRRNLKLKAAISRATRLSANLHQRTILHVNGGAGAARDSVNAVAWKR